MGYLSILLVLGVGKIASTEAGSVCPLPWNADASLPGGLNMTKPCPYGYSIPKLDVTIPDNATFFDWIWIVYGVIPFVIVGLATLDTLVRACWRRGFGTRESCFLAFVLIQVLFNELVFKRLLQQPRPDHSCNHTCGMPSSHASMSIGFFTLMFIDAVFRVMPAYPRDVAAARMFPRQDGCCSLSQKDCLLGLPSCISFTPITVSNTLSPHLFTFFVLFWGILLLPVAFTRVALNDHSPAQVSIGGTIGFIEALLYFLLLRRCFVKQFNGRIGQRFCGVFIHNYALPVFEAIGATYCLLAELEDYDADDDSVEELVGARRAIQWYLKQEKAESKTVVMLDDDVSAVKQTVSLLNTLDQAVVKKLQAFGHDVDLDEEELLDGE